MSKHKKKHKTSPTHVKTNIVVYTDGGCAFNPGGPGGYGVVVINKDTGEFEECSEGYISTTNNRMEVMAVLRAIKQTKDIQEPITIVSDSQYAINCATGVWGRNKNQDLWKLYETETKDRLIYYQWTPGHSGNPYNERCDALATQAMQQSDLKEDSGYIESKAAGREYYQELERHDPISHKGGAMAVKIDIPESMIIEPVLSSRKDYAEKYGVHTQCAAKIIDFYMAGNKSFKAYAAIKTGGCDSWSRKTVSAMLEILPEGTLDEVEKYLQNDTSIKTCLRWTCRGLTLSDSIRKVLVDQEIQDNCIGKR